MRTADQWLLGGWRLLRATQSEAGRIRRWRQADTEEEAGAAAYAGFIYAGFMSRHLTHGLGPVSSKPLSLGPTTSYLGHNDMHGAAQAAFQAGPTVTMQRLGVDEGRAGLAVLAAYMEEQVHALRTVPIAQLRSRAINLGVPLESVADCDNFGAHSFRQETQGKRRMLMRAIIKQKVKAAVCRIPLPPSLPARTFTAAANTPASTSSPRCGAARPFCSVLPLVLPFAG
jgi:hypothetical protein